MIAIGGLGGSGTRVVARCLEHFGFYLGSDLNEAKDNLWFTLLFKRPEILSVSEQEFSQLVAIFRDAMHSLPVTAAEDIGLVHSLAATDRCQHPAQWLQQRAQSLLRVAAGSSACLIAWKEPNTHIVLERLATHVPELRYIHVIRNGLDMAFSTNQNQPQLWGKLLTGETFEASPRYALHYWCRAQQRACQIGRRMGDRFHIVDYDELCTNPRTVIEGIAAFASVTINDEMKQQLCAEVKPPASIGRFRGQDLAVFDPEDIAFVASRGFLKD